MKRRIYEYLKDYAFNRNVCINKIELIVYMLINAQGAMVVRKFFHLNIFEFIFGTKSFEVGKAENVIQIPQIQIFIQFG